MTAPAQVQMALPLSRDDRLALVAVFQAQTFAILSPLMRDNLAGLCRTIELNAAQNGCRLLQEVLAAKLQTGERNLRRWLRAAAELQLVTVSNDGGRENLYEVNWDCVRRLGQTPSVTDADTAVDRTPPYASGDRVATSGETPASPREPAIPAVAGQTPAENVLPDRTNVLPARTFFLPAAREEGGKGGRSPLGLVNQDPFNPFPPFLSSARAPLNPRKCPGSPPARGPTRIPATMEVLASPPDLARWFEMALIRGWTREIDRQRVFAAARCVVRRSKRKVNPTGVGAFVRIVKRRLWHVASEADDDWARNALKSLPYL